MLQVLSVSTGPSHQVVIRDMTWHFPSMMNHKRGIRDMSFWFHPMTWHHYFSHFNNVKKGARGRAGSA